MREAYFKRLLNKRPLERMRVHTSTGTSYDIPQPDFAQADTESLIVTMQAPSTERVKEVHCSWLHVSHIEILNG